MNYELCAALSLSKGIMRCPELVEGNYELYCYKNYQLSTINYQLSTCNYLSTKKPVHHVLDTKLKLRALFLGTRKSYHRPNHLQNLFHILFLNGPCCLRRQVQ